MSNINDVRPVATKIKLSDGVEYEVKFTLNAMAELEEKYGTVDEAFKRVDEGSIKAARFVLWAGLMHNGLTEQQVGDLVDLQCIHEIMKDLGDALQKDLPPEGEQVPNAPVLAVPVK